MSKEGFHIEIFKNSSISFTQFHIYLLGLKWHRSVSRLWSLTSTHTDHWTLPYWTLNIAILLEPVCEEGPGICSHLLTLISLLIILITLPFSLCCVVQVVQVRGDTWSEEIRFRKFLRKVLFNTSCKCGCKSVERASDLLFVSCSSWKRSANVKMINDYKYVSLSYFNKSFRELFVSIIFNIRRKASVRPHLYQGNVIGQIFQNIEKFNFYPEFKSHKSKWLQPNIESRLQLELVDGII